MVYLKSGGESDESIDKGALRAEDYDRLGRT